MTVKTSNIYQFKITLEEVKPVIWRRIQVPEKYNFWDLHVAIQDAMGWDDYHLHQFEIKNPITGEKDLIGMVDFEELHEAELIPEQETKIKQYFSLTNKVARYEYDFGDCWQHKITLEKILPIEPGIKYPRCIEGARACPPEDCGGVWGYKNLLKILNNPRHEEYKESKEWAGRAGHDFDATKFDPRLVKFHNPKKRWKIAFNQSVM